MAASGASTTGRSGSGVLEWLPAPDTAPPHPHHPRPLAVILCWMWAARSAVQRHVALYHSLGCDVAVFRWPAISLWVPALADRNAAVLLRALADILSHDQQLGQQPPPSPSQQGSSQASQQQRRPPRPVLLVSFSGAAKGVLAPLLKRLAPSPPPRPPAPTHAPPPASVAMSWGPHALIQRLWRQGQRGKPSQAPAEQSNSGQPPQQPSQQQPQHIQASDSDVPQPHDYRRLMRTPAPCPRRPPSPADARAAALLIPSLAGVVFDSGPVDFDSAVGVRLFAASPHAGLRAAQAAAGGAAAGALDFVLYEWFEAQRRDMWGSLRHGIASLRLPALFLYAWAGDTLADPHPIHALAAALRAGGGGEHGCCCSGGESCEQGAGSMLPQPQGQGQGREQGHGQGHPTVPVYEQAWGVSRHVGHLRVHEAEYRGAMAAFVGRCLGAAGRGSVSDGGAGGGGGGMMSRL